MQEKSVGDDFVLIVLRDGLDLDLFGFKPWPGVSCSHVDPTY